MTDASKARALAESAEGKGDYSAAASYYRIAADLYRKEGKDFTADIMEDFAEKCDELSDEEMA